MTAVEITTSHSPADWRDAHEDSVPGAELDRIRARVAAARNRGENDAVVAVVLDEASQWRERALAAEAIVDRLKAKRAAYAYLADVAIDEENRTWLPAIVGSLDVILGAQK